MVLKSDVWQKDEDLHPKRKKAKPRDVAVAFLHYSCSDSEPGGSGGDALFSCISIRLKENSKENFGHVAKDKVQVHQLQPQEVSS